MESCRVKNLVSSLANMRKEFDDHSIAYIKNLQSQQLVRRFLSPSYKEDNIINKTFIETFLPVKSPLYYYKQVELYDDEKNNFSKLHTTHEDRKFLGKIVQ